jgi:4-hydroxythreonine-4-phosphate dehydrogenase
MLLVVTPGDPAGVGPEVVWKTLQLPKYRRLPIVCVGAREPFEKLGARIVEHPAKRPSAPHVWLISAPTPEGSFARDPAALAGFQSGWSIERATRLVLAEQLSGCVSALVTGPISKARLNRGGYPYPGHTEFLAKLCGVRDVTMMLANDQLRITLATTHHALKDVPRALTRAATERAIRHTVTHLRDWFGIARPRVAVAALNPHAGEGGLFGKEEGRIIAPAIARVVSELKGKATISGPAPADTLFAKHVSLPKKERFDAVVCMYHDQGLIPVKLLDFPRTVNVTLGLPIVRTSVDHGVAFDIAGRGVADPSSFQSALDQAIRILKNRGTIK